MLHLRPSLLHSTMAARRATAALIADHHVNIRRGAGSRADLRIEAQSLQRMPVGFAIVERVRKGGGGGYRTVVSGNDRLLPCATTVQTSGQHMQRRSTSAKHYILHCNWVHAYTLVCRQCCYFPRACRRYVNPLYDSRPLHNS